MARIIAIANQKGGVGATTTCLNLAASLATIKRKILVVDLDPQGNATTGSGINKSELVHTSGEVLLEEIPIQSAIQIKTSGNYHLLPANRQLTRAEIMLLKLDGRELRLRHALAPIQHNYDYILIDCPPSLNMLTVNAFVAAHGIMITTQCEFYALEGLSDLVATIKQIQTTVNPKLEIEGILRTMYDARSCLTQDVTDQLTEHFGDKLYRTAIPRNIRLAEAPSFGQPALLYDKKSPGAQAYLILAGEMLGKHDKVQRQKVAPAPASTMNETEEVSI